jgi:hypothetical protein
LPSAQVRVSVHTDEPAEVTCNLDRRAAQKERGVVFEAGPSTLDAGYPLHVELGHLPLSPMSHAPAGALVVLASLILLTSVLIVRGRGGMESQNVRFTRAEGKGVEPSTACAAPDFETESQFPQPIICQ